MRGHGGPGVDSGCPQFDITSDPKHCGSCTKACNANSEVCSQAVCKAANNPPDAGVPRYDAGGGIGWNLGVPACDAGACGVACPPTMSTCSDGVCYDQKNFHDHCGSCGTACMPDTEWCNNGQCCPLGQLACNAMCTDVSSDNANCGTVCSGQTPYCSNGTCVKGWVPSGSRAPLNTTAKTTTGCWTGSPCAQDVYSFSPSYGVNFQANGQDLTCSGASTCVGHVGIATYAATNVCEGAWDVYCDNTKIGNLNTVGKSCQGTAMTNGCNLTFTPAPCASIRLVATTGSGVQSCCGSSAPMIVA